MLPFMFQCFLVKWIQLYCVMRKVVYPYKIHALRELKPLDYRKHINIMVFKAGNTLAPRQAVATLACHVMLRYDLLQNEKYERVDARCGILTANSTCAVLASGSAYFDGTTAESSDHTAHEANQGCSCVSQLAVHTCASQRAEADLFGAWLALAQMYSWL